VNIYEVIKRPVISEKSQALATEGKYVFRISPKATKRDVAAAVEGLYQGTKVGKVGIAKTARKKVVWRRRGARPVKGIRAPVKKAIVTLTKGTIGIFEKKGKKE